MSHGILPVHAYPFYHQIYYENQIPPALQSIYVINDHRRLVHKRIAVSEQTRVVAC